MARTPAPLPRPLRHQPFTLAEARELGVPDGRTRRRDLRRPTAGVRVAGPAPMASDVAARCRELAPALPPDAVFCHATALVLLGIDLPFGLDPTSDLHVQVGPGSSRTRRPGVHGHTRSTADVPFLPLPGGLRVLEPELVWVRLAATLPLRELVVLGDALVRRRSPASTPTLLRRAVDALPPRTRGLRRLRAAVEHVRAGTDSCMETRLRWVLVEGGLATPEVNVPVRSATGAFVALPDLSNRDLKVAVEYDGDIHRTDTAVWRRDIRRRQAMEAEGWRVITCTADDVLRDPSRPVEWVLRALARPLDVETAETAASDR